MAINQLTVFSQNGEKNTTGLNQADGFPSAQKPKRQWFNWLFYTLTSKLNEVATQVNTNTNAIGNEAVARNNAVGNLQSQIDHLDGSVNNLIDLMYPIGIVIDFGIANFNPNTQWPGTTWVRHGEGKASVGLSTNSSDPSWTKTVGSTFGAYQHQLTIAEMPSHSHKIAEGSGELGGGGSFDANDQHTEPSNTNISETGGDAPHNNVQPSIVDARWRRTA